MPQIPVYRQRTQASGPLGAGPVFNPRDAGRGAAAVADVVQAAIDLRQREAVSEATKNLAALRERAAIIEQKQEQGRTDGTGYADAVASDYDSAVNEISGTMSREGRKLFKEQADLLRGHYATRAVLRQTEIGQAAKYATVPERSNQLRVASESDPSQWREALQEQFAGLEAMGLAPEQELAAKRAYVDSAKEGAVTGLAKSNPRLILSGLSSGKDELLASLSPEARQRVRTMAENTLVQNEANRIFTAYQGNARAGTAALAELEKSDLPPELKDDIRRNVAGSVSLLRDQRKQESIDTLTGIDSAIANDQAGASTRRQVESLYSSGALSPAEYVSYNARIDASIRERSKQDAAANEMAKAIAGGLPLDPNDADQRKGLAALFDRDTQGLPVGSDSWQRTAVAYASHTRMLPSQALAWVRQTARSPNPEVAAAGAQFLGAVRAAAPDAAGQIDSDTAAFSGMVNRMIEAGAAPAKAVETARANVFEAKKEVIETRKQTYGIGKSALQLSNNGALNDYIGDTYGSFWRRNPQASESLQADFSSQTEQYYLKTGDIDLARSLAWQDVNRVYGPTKVNGVEVISAFPVERFGVTPDQVRQDIGEFIKSSPQSDGSTAADIRLVPDAITLRQVSDAMTGAPVRPSYRLITKSGDLVVGPDGVPKRYTIPASEDIAKRLRSAQDKAQIEAEAMLQSARGARELLETERAAREAGLVPQER